MNQIGGKKIIEQIRMTFHPQLFVDVASNISYVYSLNWQKLNPFKFYSLTEVKDAVLPEIPPEVLAAAPVFREKFAINISTLIRLTDGLPFDYRETVFPKSGVKGIRKIKVYQGSDITNVVMQRDDRAVSRSIPLPGDEDLLL